MSEGTDQLIARIESLSREEAMEAGLALGQELDPNQEADRAGQAFIDAVQAAPLKHIEQTEELARLVLVAAAADPRTADIVRDILDNVGSRAFILGGAEIVALAALAVAALHVVMSRGRQDESRTTTYKFDDQGRVTEMVVEETTTYGISADLGGVVAGAVPQGGP